MIFKGHSRSSPMSPLDRLPSISYYARPQERRYAIVSCMPETTTIGKGAVSVAFVHPSVCPSVAYIANNSRTQRPSVPNFGRKVLHLRCDSHTSFKVKRSKVKVTRPINADIHRVPHLPNGKTYKLQTWCTGGGGRRPASATGAMTSKVKSQGHKVT